MKDSLIERYIYAVTKRLPARLQSDVSQEIRGLIEDMLCERCGDVTPDEKDIRVVLTELGSPRELAEKYDSSRKNCLIGAPYFVTYKYVLKIVLICVGVGMILSSVISTVIDGIVELGTSEIMLQSVKFWIDLFANMFANMFAMLAGGLIFGFAFVTLLFAIFYHNDIKIDNENLDNLPPVPKRGISKADGIVGIAFTVVFAVIFIAVPQIFCVVLDGKTFIPIFNVSYVRSTWYIIVIFALLGIVREVVKLIERQYSKKVMISTIVADVFSTAAGAFWLLNKNIINENFATEVSNIFSDDILTVIFQQFNYFFFACILLALTLDAIETIVKTIKNKN